MDVEKMSKNQSKKSKKEHGDYLDQVSMTQEDDMQAFIWTANFNSNDLFAENYDEF